MEYGRIIEIVVAFLFGGGISTYLTYLIQRRQSRLDEKKVIAELAIKDSEAARKLRDELRAELEQLRGRVEKLEEELQEERNQRHLIELEAQRHLLKTERLQHENQILRERLGIKGDLPEGYGPVETVGDDYDH